MSYVLLRYGSSAPIDDPKITHQRISSLEGVVRDAALAGVGNVLASM